MDPTVKMDEKSKLLQNGLHEKSLEDIGQKIFMVCQSIFHRLFPHGCKDEFKAQMRIALPTALAQMFQLLIIGISISFCGHLDKVLLDSAALANSIINVSVYAVLLGLSSGCDTLFPRIYGGEQKENVGVAVQTSLLILWLSCLPCCAVLINTEHVLVYLGQDTEIAKLSGLFATTYTTSLPAVVIINVLSRYLQAQSIVIPSLIIGFIGVITDIGFHILFLLILDLGIIGAAMAVSVTQWVVAISHFVYIVVSKVYLATWSGWSRDCLYDWMLFVSFAFPSLLMFCIETWSLEILIFFVGTLGVRTLGGYIVVQNIMFFFYTMTIGISAAGSVRVGTHLGAGSATNAMTAARVSMCLSGKLSVSVCMILILTRHIIPIAYTNDSDVASLVSELLTIAAVIQIFDLFQVALTGVIRGTGNQLFGAVLNLLAYGGIMLPVGILVLLTTSLGVYGPYIGLLLCGIVQSIVYVYKISGIDWQQKSQKAQSRTGVEKQEQGKTTYDEDRKLITDSLKIAEDKQLPISDEHDNESVSKTPHLNGQSLLKVVLLRLVVFSCAASVLMVGIIVKVYLDDKNSILSSSGNGTTFNGTYDFKIPQFDGFQ